MNHGVNVGSLTPRFEEALVFAFRLHAQERRKGSGVPYVAHLLGVVALVLEDGGDEDEAIAALLHDAIEEHGTRLRDEIQQRFGARVATIVEGCSDSHGEPRAPWRDRKEGHLERLAQAPPDVLRVSLADKLYNARTILADLRRCGDALWARFTGGRDGSLWYYRSLARLYRQASTSPMAGELERVVAEIERLAALAP